MFVIDTAGRRIRILCVVSAMFARKGFDLDPYVHDRTRPHHRQMEDQGQQGRETTQRTDALHADQTLTRNVEANDSRAPNRASQGLQSESARGARSCQQCRNQPGRLPAPMHTRTPAPCFIELEAGVTSGGNRHSR